MTYLLAYDVTLRRPGCVLLQGAMGGTVPQEKFLTLFKTESWLLAPTKDMKLYPTTPEQLEVVAKKTVVPKRQGEKIPTMKKAPFKIEAACTLIVAPTGDDRVLCVSRKDDPNAWGIAGGKVEPGETPKAAAKRELKEEAGLDMHMGHARRLFLGQCAVPKTGRYMLTVTYLVPTWSGEIHTEEKGRVGWRPWTDIFKGPFAEYNMALYDAYKKLSLARTFR